MLNQGMAWLLSLRVLPEKPTQTRLKTLQRFRSCFEMFQKGKNQPF